MCKNYTCRLSLALIFILIYITKLQSQVVDNRNSIFFRQRPHEKLPVEAKTEMSNSQAWQFWKAVLRGSSGPIKKEVNHFRAPYRELEQLNSTVVLYPCLQDIFFLDSTSTNQVAEATAFFTALSQSNRSDMVMRYYLPSQIFSDSVPIYFDFDDGRGWQLMSRNEYLDVVYADLSDKRIQSKVLYHGQWKTSTTILNGTTCENNLWLPQTPPWGMEDAAHPWRLSGEFEGHSYKADAFTLLSEDQVFDRPFIFVEGIDFSLTHSQYANGDFGWCQFLGLDAENYPMLSGAEQLYQELRNRGYDIILLDFYDGAADIRGNAQALKRLIQLCNLYKVGSEQLIVSGASMGGQVARIALSELEREGIPHCAGAYISMDSPHLGANIPLGLQAGLWFLSSFSADAEAFVWEALDRPAAQQLLIYQWLDSEGNVDQPWKREEYMNYLESMPFPSQTLNVAIANGNVLGHPIDDVSNHPYLLEENCDGFAILPGNEFQLRLSALPGDLNHSANSETHVVIGDAIYTETNFQWNNIVFEQHHEIMKVPRELLELDYAAGGFRQSVEQLVDVLNETSTFTNNCGEIQSDQFVSLHNFVPAYSAWAIDTTHNANIAVAQIQNPQITPFDRVYGCYNSNEPHVALNQGIMAFLLNALDDVEGLHALSQNTSWGTFNFGEVDELYFPACEINAEDDVHINAQLPLHISQNIPMQNSHHEMSVRTFCDRYDLEIHDGGKLSIGDETGLSYATLHATFGTTISVFDKGKLTVNQGSELVMESGSRLVIGDGGFVYCVGNIRLLPGSWVSYCGGVFQLVSEDSKLWMEGGTVRICTQQTLSLMPTDQQGGQVVMTQYANGNYVDWWLEEGSTLHIQGQFEQDVLVDLEEGSMWNEVAEPGASVQCLMGKINFANGAKMEHRAQVLMKSVRMMQLNGLGDGEQDIICINNKAQYRDVSFYHLSLLGEESRVVFDHVFSVGDEMWKWKSGTWQMNDAKILGHGFDFHEMNHTWMFSNSTMGGEGSDVAIQGSSSVVSDLTIDACDIFDYFEGIQVDHTNVNMNCSHVAQCQWGVTLETESRFIGNAQTGHNHFEDNGSHLHLIDSKLPWISQGQNLFGWAGSHCIQGTVSSSTIQDLQQAWAGNEWQNNGSNVAIEWNDVWSGEYGYSSNWNVQPQITYHICGDDGGEEPMAGFLKSASMEVGLWPNPGNAVLHVSNAGDEFSHVQVRDTQGKLIFQSPFQQMIEIKTEGWSAGLYYLIIQGKSGISNEIWMKL